MSSSNNISSSSKTTPLIFSQAEWKKLYPKKNSPHLYHALIAQNDANAIKEIKAPKLPNLLIAHDPNQYQITPLIIATMSGNEPAVEALLSQEIVRKQINDTDAYGWTALHHAALSSHSIFQKLIAAGANENCRTKLNGTPANLRALTSPESNPKSIQNVLFEGTPLSEEKAQRAFHMTTYRDLPYFPPEFLKNLWQQEPGESVTYAKEIVANFGPEPQKLVISPIPPGFHGLFAGEHLPIGSLIGEYGGEFVLNEHDYLDFPDTFPKDRKEKCAYLFNDFDAKKVGNATRFINNGFPNTIALGFVEEGVDKHLLISAEPIGEGEQLLFNYGAKAYDVTYGPETLFHREKIHAFFQKGLDALQKEKIAREAEIEKAPAKEQPALALQAMLLGDRLMFALNNPVCLIDLHFSGIIHAKEWLRLLSENRCSLPRSFTENNGSLVATHLKELLIRLCTIDKNIQQSHPEHYPLFQKWVLDHCQTLTIPNLIKGMEWIQEDPTCIGQIEERLKTYDWTTDPTHLYSLANRKAGVERLIDFELLKTGEANFFSRRKQQISNSLTMFGEEPHFFGSEFEKIFSAVRDSSPKTTAAQAEYLAKLKAEYQKIQTLIQ